MKKPILAMALSVLLAFTAAFVVFEPWTKDDERSELEADVRSSTRTIVHGLTSFAWPNFHQASGETHKPIGKLAVNGKIPTDSESEIWYGPAVGHPGLLRSLRYAGSVAGGLIVGLFPNTRFLLNIL